MFPLFRSRSGNSLTVLFTNVQVGPVADEEFKNWFECERKSITPTSPSKPCDNPEIKRIDVYRIHGREPLELRNRNVGDPAGLAEHICQKKFFKGFVSLWRIELSTAFGQYGYCSYDRTRGNECQHGDQKMVGRQQSSKMPYEITFQKSNLWKIGCTTVVMV